MNVIFFIFILAWLILAVGVVYQSKLINLISNKYKNTLSQYIYDANTVNINPKKVRKYIFSNYDNDPEDIQDMKIVLRFLFKTALFVATIGIITFILYVVI